MSKIISGYRGDMNKRIAKSLREQFIRPIKAIGHNHKAMFRAKRSDAGKKRK
jgi:hypothetical protein